MKWFVDLLGSFMPAFDWKDVLKTNGLATVAVVFLAVYFVLPARRDQERFTNSVIDTNKTHTESEAKFADAFKEMADALAKWTPILDRIERNTSPK